jgi:hypothetical protein
MYNNMKIQRNITFLTKNNFDMFIKIYADMVVARGIDGANDWLFETMLGNETLVNLMFFFAVDNIQKIINESPTHGFREFNKNFEV